MNTFQEKLAIVLQWDRTRFWIYKNQRKLNYDTNKSEYGINRNDFLINFKMGIYLPFYLGNTGEEIEY